MKYFKRVDEEVHFVRLDTNTNVIDTNSQSQMVCDSNTCLNEESNFDRESINRNGVLNDNIHEHDSLYTRLANSGMRHNARNTAGKKLLVEYHAKNKPRNSSSNDGL